MSEVVIEASLVNVHCAANLVNMNLDTRIRNKDIFHKL